MRLVLPSILLLLASTAACTKAAESKNGAGSARVADGPTVTGPAVAPIVGGGAGSEATGAVAGGPADPGDPVAQDSGAKKPKKEPKGPGGAPATKTSWEIVDPNGTRHGPDGSFDLAIDGPATVAPGAAATFRLRVTPGSGYKINYCEPNESDCNDFPVSLKLAETEGVTLAKASLTKADLKAFDKQQLVVEFQATPNAAGSFTVPGKYKFAVCQEEACLPRRLDLWFVVAAK